MPDSLVPPDVRDQLAQLEARIAQLERRINFTGNDRVKNEITFSYSGQLTDGTESPPIRSRYSHTLVSINFLFGTPGTTNTVMEVKRAGTVIETVTIPANQRRFNAVIDADVGKDQEDITLRIVTAGTNAADLTAQARFA